MKALAAEGGEEGHYAPGVVNVPAPGAVLAEHVGPAWRAGVRRGPAVGSTTASEQGIDTLPLVPLWSGFLLDTAIYSSALATVYTAVSAARAALRRRGGACTVCGYPVGVSPVCTECGSVLR